jgi:hypothetical protein
MMAANGTQALREKVLFPPNQPVRLALKYAQPKIGKSPSGDDYALFTTTDNKVFFLDCDEARVITGAGILPGQDIDVTMRWSGKRGDPKIYGVSLPSGTAAYGAQPNGTFAVPSTQHPAPSTQPETKLEWELRTSLELQDLKRKLALAEQEKRAAAAPREQPATAPVVHSQVNSGQPRNVAATNHSTTPMTGQGETLLQSVNHAAKELFGVYVDVLAWAREEHGSEIARPEDVRALVTSCFIEANKRRGC